MAKGRKRKTPSRNPASSGGGQKVRPLWAMQSRVRAGLTGLGQDDVVAIGAAFVGSHDRYSSAPEPDPVDILMTPEMAYDLGRQLIDLSTRILAEQPPLPEPPELQQ